MHTLVVSPIPSHPQDQGNSARIHAMGEALRGLGHTLHFVYVMMEGLDPERASAMRGFWDFFYPVELSRSRQRAGAEAFLLDDWYERRLDPLLDRLFAEFRFDFMVVNYVWFSRAFLRAPAETVKVLDTHDVFGDRHRRLLADGIAPAWYWTTPSEEGEGLARADLVLAIQADEAATFRTLSATPVRVVGHLLPARFLPPPERKAGSRPRVGYLASGNPTNVFSFENFCRSVRRRPELADAINFVAAGAICEASKDGEGVFRRLGYVADVDAFYAGVDAVINPNLGGTGLKIKSVEALSYGRPLIATADAMLGIESDAPEHRCASTDEMCEVLMHAAAEGGLSEMARTSRRVFLDYQTAQFEALIDVFGPYALARPDPGGGVSSHPALEQPQADSVVSV